MKRKSYHRLQQVTFTLLFIMLFSTGNILANTLKPTAPPQEELFSKWQGEWGNWQKVNGQFQGSNITIIGSTFFFDYLDKNTLHSKAIDVRSISPTTVQAVAINESSISKCELTFHLVEDKGKEAIYPKLNGKKCDELFKGNISASYPRKSMGTYPITNDNDSSSTDHLTCYLDSSALRQTWCTNGEIYELNNELADIVKQHPHTKLPSDLITWKESIFKLCEKNQNPINCFIENYRNKIETYKNQLPLLIKQEQKEQNTPGNTQQAVSIINNIQGLYKDTTSVISEPDKEAEDVDNQLLIVPQGDNKIYFTLRLHFDYSHTCSAGGVADFNLHNEFIYTVDQQDMHCRLRLIPDKAGINIEDDGTCEGLCGARGKFSGANFSTKSSLSETGPSFDCNKASSSIEKAICHNKDFAKLDVLIDKFYKKTKKSHPDVKSEQERWLKVRNECSKEKNINECLNGQMTSRMDELIFYSW